MRIKSIIALTGAVKEDSSASLSPLEGKMDGRRRLQMGSLKGDILGEGDPLEANPIRCREGEPLGVNPIHLEKGTPLKRNHSLWRGGTPEGDSHLFRRR